MTQRLVDETRRMARALIARGDAEVAAVVLALVSERGSAAMRSSPACPDLRDWQDLADDLEVALEPIDVSLAAVARTLALELSQAVLMRDRNPASQLARRPTSRRVLKALIDLGGVRCPLAAVRERSHHGPTHFSNTLQALTAHGFVSVEPDSQDGRNKRISITTTGLEAMNARNASQAQQRYTSTIRTRTSTRQTYQENLHQARSSEPAA
jgi:DNA-binding MarR family transcriptional regulator